MESITRIQPKSFQSKAFWREYFKPVVLDKFLQNINDTPLSILICAPGSSQLIHDELKDITGKWEYNDFIQSSYNSENFDNEDERLNRLARKARDVDIIFGIFSNDPLALRLFKHYKDKAPTSKLCLFIDKPVLSNIQKLPDLIDLYDSKHLIKRELELSQLVDNGQFYLMIEEFVHALKTTKCHYSPHKSSHLSAHYHAYKKNFRLLCRRSAYFY